MQDKNINFVINGEIYLKRGPEIFDSSSAISKIDAEIKEIEFNISKENPNFSIVSQLKECQDLKDRVKSFDGQLDYRGTKSFWQVFTADGHNYIMRECQQLDNIKKNYNSIEELNKYFIKLSDFFKESTFIGRMFKRTRPLKDKDGNVYDRNYTNHGIALAKYIAAYSTKYIVLYATRELFLVKKINETLGNEYDLINSKYIQDGNYEFFGPVYEEYHDENKVYREILEQVSEYNKGKGKK